VADEFACASTAVAPQPARSSSTRPSFVALAGNAWILAALKARAA